MTNSQVDPHKGGWRDASAMLWDFSQSNEHCIHLSTRKTINSSHFVFAMSAFVPVEISYSNTIFKACNKLTAEVLICLVSFYSMAENN